MNANDSLLIVIVLTSCSFFFDGSIFFYRQLLDQLIRIFLHPISSSNYHGPEFLATEMVSKFITARIPDAIYSIVCEDRSKTNLSTSEMIIQFAQESNATTLIVGQFGRKGPSVWGTGSNTINTMQQTSNITIVTAKINSRSDDSPQTFFVGADGSNRKLMFVLCLFPFY